MKIIFVASKRVFQIMQGSSTQMKSEPSPPALPLNLASVPIQTVCQGEGVGRFTIGRYLNAGLIYVYCKEY